MSAAPQPERGPKSRDGCARGLKIRAALQQERSKRPKVPRQDCASDLKIRTVAPRHNKSDPTGPKWREGCAGTGHMLDSHKTLRPPRNMNIENVKSDVLLRSQSGHKVLPLPRKIIPPKRWPTTGNVLGACRKCHTCYADEQVSESCTCHGKRRLRLQHVPKVSRLPRKMDIAQKTSMAR